MASRGSWSIASLELLGTLVKGLPLTGVGTPVERDPFSEPNYVSFEKVIKIQPFTTTKYNQTLKVPSLGVHPN